MIATPLVDPTVFDIGPIAITQSVVTTWIIMAGLIGTGAVLVRIAMIGSLGQEALLALYEAVSAEVGAALGGSPQQILPFLGTLFVFIAAANSISLLPGFEAPTARPETTAALALIVIVAVQVYAVRARGVVSYLKHFLHPNPLFLPLNLVSEFTRVVSLMMRLFGNMMSHGFVIAILLSIVGFLVPIPFMALGLMIGLVQAYIFTILAAVYIGAASHDEEQVDDR
jgi:F-type H+-transporting ATPase subunit a